jgi:hypothetical protein
VRINFVCFTIGLDNDHDARSAGRCENWRKSILPGKNKQLPCFAQPLIIA